MKNENQERHFEHVKFKIDKWSEDIQAGRRNLKVRAGDKNLKSPQHSDSI